MSDNKEPSEGKGASTEPKGTPGPKGSGPTEVKAKKGWSNPALRMMGIPRISLPSRNWMIFWSVLAGIGGGIAYDKYQQTQIRKRYMAEVEHLSQEVFESKRLPRKLTIFVAPPPDDFLDVSMKYFRKYVKPILNSAAVDFDVMVSSKQGDIRSAVSDKIRQLRKEVIEREAQEHQKQVQQAYDKSWKKFVTVTVPGILKMPFGKVEETDEVKSYRDLYSAKDVVGYYYRYEPIVPVKDDSLDLEKAGGIVCVGRGAYKEYIQGLHEGLLGPLEPPEQLKEPEQPKIEPVEAPLNVPEVKDLAPAEEQAQPEAQLEAQPEVKEPEVKEPEPETEEEKNPVPKPFILPPEYANAQLAPEFNYTQPITDDKNVPVLFQQPIYVFPVPNILGFKNIPRKIFNFFTRRHLTEDFSERTMHLIHNTSRPFEYKDQYLAKEEELLWPKKWVEKGKDKNSEWVQELVADERVTSLLRVYE